MKSWGHQSQSRLRFRNQSNFEQPNLMEHSLVYCLHILPALEAQSAIVEASSYNFAVSFTSAVNANDRPALVVEEHYSNELS